MWDLPRPGLEPVFPALAERFLTTAPPGKSIVLDVEPFLHPWNSSHLIMVFDPFNVLLYLVCLYFVEDFASLLIRVIGL